jgi:aspartate aminotransferase
MRPLSNTVTNIEPPDSIEVAQAAAKREREGHDVINLGWGEPHFRTPKPIRDSLHEAVRDGHTNYTDSAGIQPLRERVAKKLTNENGINATPDEIIVTPGAKQAIFLSIRTLVDRDDEILIPEPAWTSYAKMVELAEADPVPISGRAENRFVPTREQIEEAGTDPKAIIVNTPTNPTGAVWTEEELKDVAAVARERDLYVISDEVYEHYTFDNREHVSIGSFEGMQDRTITVNGFSKSHAMTGWRLGYLRAAPRIRDPILKANQHLNTCATSFVQHAGVDAFDATDHLEEVVQTYQTNRDTFVENVPYPVVKPEGAFYCLVDVRDYTDDTSAYAEELLKDTDVALTPGGTYGETASGFLRASLALKPELIRTAAERLRDRQK